MTITLFNTPAPQAELLPLVPPNPRNGEQRDGLQEADLAVGRNPIASDSFMQLSLVVNVNCHRGKNLVRFCFAC
jgi:hypothetical protein